MCIVPVNSLRIFLPLEDGSDFDFDSSIALYGLLPSISLISLFPLSSFFFFFFLMNSLVYSLSKVYQSFLMFFIIYTYINVSLYTYVYFCIFSLYIIYATLFTLEAKKFDVSIYFSIVYNCFDLDFQFYEFHIKLLMH